MKEQITKASNNNILPKSNPLANRIIRYVSFTERKPHLWKSKLSFARKLHQVKVYVILSIDSIFIASNGLPFWEKALENFIFFKYSFKIKKHQKR